MQNKPNVKDAQINVNSYMKSKYEKLDTWLSGKNRPNSNPIKPNFQKAKMNVNLTLTKDYKKNDCLAAQKTNPIQTQFLQRPKSLAKKSGHHPIFAVADFFVVNCLQKKLK